VKSQTLPDRLLSRLLPVLIALAGLMQVCASVRSGLDGKYPGESVRNSNTRPVSVVFIFDHVTQTVGYDAIPKLLTKRQTLGGFDDLFQDALRELSNVGPYATFTDEAADVNLPARRTTRDSLMTKMDYTVKIRIESKKRFSSYFLGTLASTVSATLLPVPYRTTYTLKAEVFDRNRTLLGEYSREAHMTKWVEACLIVVYPFYPAERVREEIYMELLHDTFRQIESEMVLK
jgi:hypothetical protein